MTFTEEETIKLATLIEQHKIIHERMKTECSPSCFKNNLKDAVNFVIGKRKLATTTGLMTDEEHQAMEMSAQLWNYINKHVVIAGPTRDSDLREIMFHIHGIQRALLGQAAARAYPDQYRLLGGRVAGDGEEMPVAPWIMQPMIHKDGPYPWGSGRTPVEEQSEDRRTDEPLGHSCSCHARGGGCDVCVRLNCPVGEE